MDKTPKLDKSQLTTDQLAQLEAYDAAQKQLRELQDIATMAHEAINLLDEQKKTGTKTISDFGALLVDIRESLTLLNDKEAPEMPDYAKPVVGALSKLETALTAFMKVKPQINVAAPNVNVESAPVDLSGVEKALQGMPNAFKEAISLIPKVEIPETNYQPLLDAWAGISEQLLSLENATRMKPLPGSMKVSNLAEIATAANTEYAVELDNTADPILYVGKASVGSSTASPVWKIARLNTSTGLIKTWADGDSNYNNIWDNRSSLTYL